MQSLLALPALELAALIRSGEVAARELAEAALSRIAQVDPVLNAMAVVDAERAMDQAAAVRSDDPRPFAGVPIAVKDMVAQRGVPCAVGSRLLQAWRPSYDAYTVQRLTQAGFVLLGRTAMCEFGILPTTESRWAAAPTRNPWRLDRTPGGSSGGAATAVAAGIVPVAHGGDGGGSLRVPAACCGLVGLKPSRGRISAGPAAGDDPLVTEGVLTRTVADTAALLDVLAGYQPGDATWAPPPARQYLETVRRAQHHPPEGLRIGLALEPPLPVDVDPGCEQAATDAGRLLEELGHHVEPISSPTLDEATRRSFDDVWAVLAAEGVRAGHSVNGRPAGPEDVEPLTWALYEQAQRIDALQLRAAQAALAAAAREIVTTTRVYDALLTPALAQPPVPIGAIHGWRTPDPLVALEDTDRFTPYTALWNMTGQPAITVPLFTDPAGLPLAVQLVGRPADESTLLALAASLELVQPWADRLQDVPCGHLNDDGVSAGSAPNSE